MSAFLDVTISAKHPEDLSLSNTQSMAWGELAKHCVTWKTSAQSVALFREEIRRQEK